MPLAVECTDCKKRYAVDEKSAGKSVKCRNCGNVFTAQPLAKLAAKPSAAAAQVARSAAARPQPAAAGATAGATAGAASGRAPARAVAASARGAAVAPSAPPVAPPAPLPPPPPPVDEPPDFDALLALSAAEQSAPPSAGGAPPLPPPPPMAPPFAPPPAPYLPPPPPPGYGAPAAAMAPALPLGYVPRRRERSNMAVGMDNVTPYFILLFLGAKVFDVFHSISAMADVPDEVKRHLKLGPGAFIMAAFVDALVFFAVVATLVWLATIITAKIMKFELPDSAYMKAAGVAAIPSVIVTLMQILPMNLFIVAFLVLAIIPVTLWVLKFAFDMTWPETMLSFVFVAPLYVAGQVVRGLVLMAVMLGFGVQGSGFFSGHKHSPPVSIDSPDDGQSDPSRNNGNNWQSSQSPSFNGPGASNADALADRVTGLQRSVEELSNRPTEHSSREEMLAQEQHLRAQIESQRASLASKPGFDGLIPQLDALKQKFMALPSEKPEEAVFRDPTPTATWDDAATAPAGALGPEISFKEFKLRPPADAKLDLRTSENDANGLSWHDPKSFGANMSIAFVPRQNPAQKQPWFLTQSFMTKVRDQQRLFAVEATDGPAAPPVVGRINGLTFTRFEPDPQAQRAFDRWVKYVALDGDRWLVVTIRSPKDDARVKEEFELSAHTLRKAAAEPHVDAFAPAALVERLADDPTQATALLRRQGPAAEDALLAGLTAPESRVRRQCATLLRDMATAKSLPALREAAKSEDREVYEAARAALRRLAPKEFDAVAEALLDLKGTGHREKEHALAALAAATPDSRRAEVATVLEDMLVNKKATFVEKQVAKALSTWYGPNTVTRLLPMLSKDINYWGAPREAAMEVLGATKDKRAVLPIMDPWLLEDSEHAVAALIKIGQPAEDELVAKRAMWHQNAQVRIATAHVLQEIGTAKSLEGLRRGAHDPRDAAAAAAAQQALDAVTARLAANKPATKQGR